MNPPHLFHVPLDPFPGITPRTRWVRSGEHKWVRFRERRGAARGKPQALPDTPGEGGSVERAPEVATRPLEAADIAHLESLALEDFAVSFDHVEIPQDRRLSDEELTRAVDRFLQTMAD